MNYHPVNFEKLNSNKLTIVYKKPIKLNHCYSENNDDQNNTLNFDIEKLNSLKGIEKVTRIKSKKENESPIKKINSEYNKNIFEFADYLYNKEEHFNKNHILSLKNLENDSPQQHNLLSPKKITIPSNSSRCNKSQSTRMIGNLSNVKNLNNIKTSLFKKDLDKFSTISLKKKSRNRIKNKLRDSNKINHRFANNYSIFFKLKEKTKIPSKTPYLDRKSGKVHII